MSDSSSSSNSAPSHNKVKTYSKADETKVESALQNLLQGISTAIANHRNHESNDGMEEDNSDLQTVYSKLFNLSRLAYELLHNFGKIVELSAIPDNNPTNIDMVSENYSLAESTRERWRNVGRSVWMMIRSHPAVFSDAKQQQYKNLSSKALSGGYIRAIAARLILLNGFQTKGLESPILVQTSIESDENRIPLLSVDELEFGLKSFSRAGRCLLLNSESSDPTSATISFVTLRLASICWRAMNDELSRHPADSFEKDRIDNAFEEAFDAMALLPEAATLVFSFGAKSSSETTIGDADHIVELLEDLGRVVMNDEFLTLSKKQRCIPILARAAYKQGNRLAQNGAYSKSRECLRISLSATDISLAAIRAGLGTSPSDSFKALERELLVISKECLYVLAHTCQAIGKYIEAYKCLDQIEVYINDQKKRDDDLYSKVIDHLSTNANDDTTGLPISSGPRALDKQDIRSRAQTTHARSKITQYRERANLAFSRTMLLHHQCNSHDTIVIEDDIFDEIEDKLDNEICKLVDLSAKFLGSNGPAVAEADTSIFELTLKACRFTRVRRLIRNILRPQNDGNISTTLTNPYDLMFSKHNETRGKYLVVAIDHLNAVVSACHEVRTRKFSEVEENNETNESSLVDSVGIESLDLVGTQVAEDVMSSLEILWKEKYIDNGDNTSIIPVSAVEGITSITVISLAEQAKIQFSRALALYRTLPSSHGLIVQYADFLVDTLKIISQYYERSNQQQENDITQMVAEVLGIKAYALSSSGSFVSGLNSARLAWKTACTTTLSPGLNQTEIQHKTLENSCKVHNLVVLFYCSIKQDFATWTNFDSLNSNKRSSVSRDILIELDDALSELCLQDRLSIFPVLSQSCLNICGENCDNDVDKSDVGHNYSHQILLGIQERWVSLLTDYLSKSEISAFPFDADNPQINLFSLLRAYLINFEELFCPLDKPDEIQSNYDLANPEKLDHMLASIISIIKDLRDNKYSENSSENEARNGLIWEEDEVQKSIGVQQDCVWIAEQSWNIAVQLMNSIPSKNISTKFNSKMIASHLFVKAHDFALLSEEECGMHLTRGFIEGDLDSITSDISCQDHSIDHTLISFDCKSPQFVCELSSEFSAHCLLLSLANAVDSICYNNTEQSQTDFRSLLLRICQCRDEFISNLSNKGGSSKYKKENDVVLSWLALRILIEIGDDIKCVKSLDAGNILSIITEVRSTNESYNETEDESVASHLYLCSKRAQSKKMLATSKLLLRKISFYLSKNGKSRLAIPCTSFSKDQIDETSEKVMLSFGDIQRKLIQLASSINETISIFEDISNSSVQIYSKECLNWFTIEAYNRGINLLYLGEIPSAERLLAVALNLLPSCGKEVECHSSEMRLAYHRAVESKNGNIFSLIGSPTSVSGNDSLDLFCRMQN